MSQSIRLSGSLALLATLAVMACSDPTSTPADSTAAGEIGITKAHLVQCPTDESVSASALVLPLVGGVVSAGGSSISIPAGALLSPETIAVTVPASRYMQIDVSALGVEHLLFQTPSTITLDYSRCTDSALGTTPLTVWYIDPLTEQPLEDMHGVDDRAARRITFTTPHLSGYAIAN